MVNNQYWIVSIMKNLPEVIWMMLCIFYRRFILRVEGSSINVSKWCLIDPVKSKWCVSLDLLACAICMCIFKGETVTVYKWLSLVHLVMCEVAIVPQSKSIKLFRDVTTGPNLSLTADHIFLSHSLDFGGVQWSRCRNCSRFNLLFLLTLCPCRFPFHTQVMILLRSYYRLSSLAIASCRWMLPLHYHLQ